ncbi:pollen receptor-like kinase 1 [Cornus florida]|uniref:pollen receptor-like kinase 1 n=1 Tax=Cornus florida TaxID=4283 RepID=UPI0028A12F8D|nr:pollen receptor-like kinase 1 [Cornus florida]
MAHSYLRWSLVGFIVSLHVLTSCNATDSESEILLKFKDSLGYNAALASWNSSTSPCSKKGKGANWEGVNCENRTISGLQLENIGLTGDISFDALRELESLRTISVKNNSLEGPMPNIKIIPWLRSVFLSNNKFSGDIPADAFDGLTGLRKVHLAENKFTGQIPLSLTILPRLLDLRLEGNQFEGEIPDFVQKGLEIMNVSNNALEGPIPSKLGGMDASSFLANKDLCGRPLAACSPPKLSLVTIVTVVIAVVAALAAIATVFFILYRRRSQAPPPEEAPRSERGHTKSDSSDFDKMETGMPEISSHGKKDENGHGKLIFLKDDVEKFDLQSLLKASAEMLGSGSFGSSYKASLVGGPVMVVKRFRKMNNVNREDFQEHVRRLGRLRHPNLLPLVAYYYTKDEKLLVNNFVNNVSLAVHLHGNRYSGKPRPDWAARLKIIKGVAKGLQFLYTELPALIAPHGHLKSSNVLLGEIFEPLLTDYGLIPLVDQEHAQEIMVAYKAPEYKQHRRITKKTDIWSLGILILETLTGKFPASYLQHGKGSDGDLAAWVKSIVRDEGTTVEVFDKEIGATKNSEGEMMKLLRVGLACCENEVEHRCDLREAIERIEEVKEKDSDDEFYSSYASEGDRNSSRGLSDDFNFSQ